MKSIGLLLTLIMVSAFARGYLAQETSMEGKPAQSQQLADAQKFPALGSNLASFSKAKLVLNRATYRREDLIKLDVGLLLTNTVDHYFPSEFDFRIYVRDSNGASVGIKQVANVDKASRPRFEKQGKTLLVQSNFILVSCNSRSLVTFSSAFEGADLDNSVELFEKNLFAMPVGTCLEINHGAVLNISVEVYNNKVVVPAPGDSTKTLVGSVRSVPVQIRIEE